MMNAWSAYGRLHHLNASEVCGDFLFCRRDNNYHTQGRDRLKVIRGEWLHVKTEACRFARPISRTAQFTIAQITGYSKNILTVNSEKESDHE